MATEHAGSGVRRPVPRLSPKRGGPPWRDIAGPFEGPDVEYVQSRTRRAFPLPVVEVGVLRGRSTAAIQEVIGEGQEHWVVDNFRGSTDETDRATQLQQCPGRNILGEFWENMGLIRARARIRMLVMDSFDAALLFEGRELGFVFLDADHSERGVLMDLEAWSCCTVPGGCIGGHDAHEVPGRVSQEWAGQRGLKWSIPMGNCWEIERS